MAIDKVLLQKLRTFAQVFKDAADRGANESDTVMYLVKFFEDVLGYNSLAGEISKEVAIRDRYCDFGLRLNGLIRLLVEAKAAGGRNLRDRDIEQAENYASRSGLRWVMLTNGIEWRLYHLTFTEGEGIAHDVAFSFNLVEDLDAKADYIGSCLDLLTRQSFSRNALDDFWSQKKALAPASLVRILFNEKVLTAIRREVNRHAEARLEVGDVFLGVRDIISKEALLEAGDISLPRKRRKRRKSRTVESAPQGTDTAMTDGQTSPPEVPKPGVDSPPSSP